jgi:hypothetical protein
MDTFETKLNMGALEHLFKIAPAETKKATANFLNDQAFTYRELAPKVLSERYIIRNKAFVQSMFRVEKASPTGSPDAQKAKAGSIKSNRFTGWIEEVTGQAPERKRLVGDNARSGDRQVKASQSNRLMAGMDLPKPSDFDDIPERMRIPAMISILARNPDYTADSHGMFLIKGGKWIPGIYRFQRGQTAKWVKSKSRGIRLKDKRDRATYERPKVTRVQTLGQTPTPRKFDWPKITTDRLRVWFRPDDVWAHYFNDIIKHIK